MSYLSDVMNASELWPCYRDGMVLVTDESGKSIAMNVLEIVDTAPLVRHVDEKVIQWWFGVRGKYGDVVVWDPAETKWIDAGKG